MSTLWLDKFPGQLPMREDLDGSCALLIGTPDYIRLPPELGGRSEDVLGVRGDLCPKCGCAPAMHYRLETLCVAECDDKCGFVWYRERKEETDATP